MADETANIQPPPPTPPLTQAAIDSATEIANWCEEQRTEAEKLAKAQIRMVWVLLLGGLILLLTLPRLIEEIDILWKSELSLPKPIVERAKATKQRVETAEMKMREEVADADKRRNEIAAQVAAAEEERDSQIKSLRSDLTAPLSLWRSSLPNFEGTDFAITAINSGHRGMIAAAIEGDALHVWLLLLHSTDGHDWTAIRPQENGERIEGELSALLVMPDGTMVATGGEGSVLDNHEVLLLRSTDGGDWTAIRPEENGERIEGKLAALTIMPDGTMIAAGGEGNSLDREVLLLHSTDGSDWTAIRPEENGERIKGELAALTIMPSGTMIAAGTERNLPEQKVLLLRSTDGHGWTAIRPEENGDHMVGGLLALTSLLDGTIFAAGYSHQPKSAPVLLLLRSTDGRDWTAIRPKENGDHIAGALLALATLPEGELVAAGGEGYLLNECSLLRRSSDGRDWIVIRPEQKGLRIGGGFVTDCVLAVAPDGRIVAGGSDFFITSLPAQEAKDLAEQVLQNDTQPPGLHLPAGSAERLSAIASLRREVERLKDNLGQQEKFVASATASLKRQSEAVKDVADLPEELDKALRANEVWRQVGQTATRLAVIALLVYLVQIVVNRYRYLQRLAGFYQARAQAFHLLAASSRDTALMQDMTLADLTSLLSPDAIGFDKSAEPPIREVVSLLQTGLRKG